MSSQSSPPPAPSQAESRHCYSTRLLRPFARALRSYPNVPPEVVAASEDLDPDGRVPIAAAHELLSAAIAVTGDENVGLRAAEMIEIGDTGALEYAASTATTSREALETIGRYVPLVNDALSVTLETRDDLAIVTLDSAVVLPRAAEAFQVGAFFKAFWNRASDQLEGLPIEVLFTHEEPEDRSAYERFFGPCSTVRFGHTFCGWILPAHIMDARLASEDPHLHELISKHADHLLEGLPKAASFTARVRELVAAGLARGNAGGTEVAETLHVSPRTLARRLEEEGTTFKELTEQLRRSLALRYVGQTDLAFSEIAFLVGFSQAPAFHRAFKRWTGETPLQHRTTQRG